MATTVWTGAISFGMVSVPIKAQVATRSHDVSFVRLHEEDGERIRRPQVCPEHGEVPYDETVRGYKVRKGEYVVVTDDEMDALEPEKSDTIEIEAFVKLEEVDPVFFDRTYHLIPEPVGAKAYRLLTEAMQETERIAIGRFVMRSKEHLVALRPLGDGLVMETLHFGDEVVPAEEAEEVSSKKPSKKEREMSVSLVEGMATKFDPDDYEDLFRQRMMEMIEAKAQGESIEVEERKRPAEVADLEEALERSLKEIKGS